ncbi:PREDICTED: probable E3 ubiquitin-protein ligase XERICO [Populus euphratica]|uniref:Probable E3 ubiquitin-protein ligase XERICO n=1 Tax=Populus euphratica TaxID=75702 RepID=A0AAJ6T7J9_POPEU|nr:PREDICTED: probable E3 ubiquitin-protein ligase XERICO [Populus euphratica]
MAALLNAFPHLYTISVSFFNLLLLKALFLIRSFVPGSEVTNPDKLFRIISSQYLNIIEKTNPTLHYSEKISRAQYRECAVCLSEFTEGERVRKLKCDHTFHQECLDKWLQQSMATCPLCRTTVLPDQIVVNYHQLRDNILNGGSYDDTIFLLSALYGSSLEKIF